MFTVTDSSEIVVLDLDMKVSGWWQVCGFEMV